MLYAHVFCCLALQATTLGSVHEINVKVQCIEVRRQMGELPVVKFLSLACYTSIINKYFSSLATQTLSFNLASYIPIDMYFDRESTVKDDDSRTLPDGEEIQKKNQGEKETKGKREKKLKSQDVGNVVNLADSSAVLQGNQVSLHEKKHSLPERKRERQQKLLITPGGLWYDLVSIGTHLVSCSITFLKHNCQILINCTTDC